MRLGCRLAWVEYCLGKCGLVMVSDVLFIASSLIPARDLFIFAAAVGERSW